MAKKLLNNHGFTMLEIIVVLIMMGILTAVAISRNNNVAEYAVTAEVNQLKTHVRYAQSVAMSNSETLWFGIELVPGTTDSYSFFKYDTTKVLPDALTVLILPGEEASVQLTSRFSGITADPFTFIAFDNWGRPLTPAVLATKGLIPPGVVSLTSITLRKDGSNVTHKFDVEPETGFIG